MSITQSYYLAHKARAKLSREAERPDQDLRLLVAHANLLDSLKVEFTEAESEQERWFNSPLRNTGKNIAYDRKRHIQWADRSVEEGAPEDDYDESSDSDSDFDSDYDQEEKLIAKMATVFPRINVKEVEEEGEEDENYINEDYAQLELVCTPSHGDSPPKLLVDHDDSDSSDDDSMPTSPTATALPQPTADFKKHVEKQQVYGEEESYLRRRATGLINAIMVY